MSNTMNIQSESKQSPTLSQEVETDHSASDLYLISLEVMAKTASEMVKSIGEPTQDPEQGKNIFPWVRGMDLLTEEMLRKQKERLDKAKRLEEELMEKLALKEKKYIPDNCVAIKGAHGVAVLKRSSGSVGSAFGGIGIDPPMLTSDEMNAIVKILGEDPIKEMLSFSQALEKLLCSISKFALEMNKLNKNHEVNKKEIGTKNHHKNDIIVQHKHTKKAQNKR